MQHAALQRVHSLVAAIRDALADPQQKEQAIVIAATLVGALQVARALGDNAQGKSVLAATRHSLLAAHDTA